MEQTKKTLKTYCKVCHKYYDVPKEKIFSGGEFSKYATRCPICRFGRKLPFEDVEAIYGNLNV